MFQHYVSSSESEKGHPIHRMYVDHIQPTVCTTAVLHHPEGINTYIRVDEMFTVMKNHTVALHYQLEPDEYWIFGADTNITE